MSDDRALAELEVDVGRRALCKEVDPGCFFPERGQSTAPAKAVCRRCPVREECLTLALARDERFGVWGGLSEPERRALHKGRDALAVLRVAQHAVARG